MAPSPALLVRALLGHRFGAYVPDLKCTLHARFHSPRAQPLGQRPGDRVKLTTPPRADGSPRRWRGHNGHSAHLVERAAQRLGLQQRHHGVTERTIAFGVAMVFPCEHRTPQRTVIAPARHADPTHRSRQIEAHRLYQTAHACAAEHFIQRAAPCAATGEQHIPYSTHGACQCAGRARHAVHAMRGRCVPYQSMIAVHRRSVSSGPATRMAIVPAFAAG